MDTLSATLIRDHRLFDSLEGDESEAVILYRVETPFVTMKSATKNEDSDVRIKGPVYVGDDDMLDRHNELVDNDAIIEAWEGYRKNPVILYNHSKTYGVIGVMEDVSMGSFKKPDGSTVSVPIGVARIDSGEKDITRKIQKGMLRAFSIGFIAKAAVKECKDEDSCYMKFTEIEWLETSVVDVPASPGALFSVEKSLLSSDIANVDFSIDEVYDSNRHGHFEVEPKVHATILRSEEKSCDGGSSCTCGEKKDMEIEEKHIVAVEEDDDNYYLTFGKAEEMGYKPDDDEKMRDALSQILDRLSLIEATFEALEEKGNLSESVNTPLSSSEKSMTTEDIENTTEEVEEKTLLEEADEVPETTPIMEDVQVKSEDEAEDEEVAEEAVEEDVADEADEEVVEEEVAEDEDEAEEEAVEEKDALPSTVEVLMQVVKALADMDASVQSMSARIDETEQLKEALNERDATIQTLTEEKAQAEQEAEIEAEVAKRIAERVGDAPIACLLYTSDAADE